MSSSVFVLSQQNPNSHPLQLPWTGGKENTTISWWMRWECNNSFSNSSFRPKNLRTNIIIARNNPPPRPRFLFVANRLFAAVRPLLRRALLRIIGIIIRIIMQNIIRKTRREWALPWTSIWRLSCLSRKSRLLRSHAEPRLRALDTGQTLLGLPPLPTTLFATERGRAVFEHG